MAEMKIKFPKIFFLILFTNVVMSQENLNYNKFKFSITGGLGINLTNSVDFTDYLNSLSSKRYDDFFSNPEFFISVGYLIDVKYSICLDYTYIINSFNTNDYNLGSYQNHLTIHIPAIIINQTLMHDGVILKAGVGVAYARANFEQTIMGSFTQNYRSDGFGFKFIFEANTPFGDNFFGYLGSDIKIFFVNDFKTVRSDKLYFIYNGKTKNVDLDFFSASLKFGFVYYL